MSLDDSLETVPTSFRESGYRTALVSDNHFVSGETGLDRGFETAEILPKDPMGIVRTLGVWPVAKWVARLSRHSAGFELDKYRHSTAYLMTSLVRKRLEELASQSDPFFLYAHFNQPHRPYYPPIAWFDQYSDEFDMSRSEAGDFSMDVHRNLQEKVAQGCPFSDDEWAALRALYDAQIEYTDVFIGELFELIRNRFDDTIVVVTSDHGEHLGEHGALGHKYVLDDALLRVPLVTSGLDLPTTGAPVQHTDVMRTLLEVAGADGAFVDGIDLREETRDFAVSQDESRSLDPLYAANPEFDPSTFFPGAERSLPQRTAIRTKTHRYVRGEDGSQVLYRASDETEDISSLESKVARSLDEKADAWLRDHRLVESDSGSRADSELTDATKSHLKNMGYLEENL